MLLNKFINSLQSPACVVNKENEILHVNQEFQHYFDTHTGTLSSIVGEFLIEEEGCKFATCHTMTSGSEVKLLWHETSYEDFNASIFLAHYKHPVESVIWFYENIIDLMPGHVFWKDTNGVLKGCNRNLMLASNCSHKSQVIGTTAYDVLPKKLADNVTKSDQIVLNQDQPYIAEEPFETKEGNTIIFLSNKSALKNEYNEVVGILGISIDITAEKLNQQIKKQAEKEIALLKKQVELSELVGAAVAHEVRTPLGAVQIAMSAISDAVENGEINEIEHICNEVRGHLKQANTFIDMFLRNVKEEHAVSTDTLSSVTETIHKAVDKYAYISPADKTLIKIPKDLIEFQYYCNQSLIEHVLANLIKNALYFVKKAGKGHIEIFTSLGEEFNCLHFKDTGYGIPEDQLPRIFDRFYTSTDVGTGVGLAFSKQILESIGGKIICHSEFQKYTEFELYFPNNN